MRKNIYIDRKTGIVFRIVDCEIPFFPATLDETFSTTVSDRIENEDAFKYKWQGRLIPFEGVISETETERLKLAAERCMALEMLYDQIVLQRAGLIHLLPYEDKVMEYRFREAQAFLQTGKPGSFLDDYCELNGITQNVAAHQIILFYHEFYEALRASEHLKLTWEKKIRESTNPLALMEEFFNSTVHSTD